MQQQVKHLILSGRVQGVGFRHFTTQQANELGIRGWVKNLPDGRLETVIAGTKKDVEEMVQRMEKGPRMASVSEISELDPPETMDQFKSFSVVY